MFYFPASSQQIPLVPVFVIEDPSAEFNPLGKLTPMVMNRNEEISEDIHDMQEYHTSNRSSPDSPQMSPNVSQMSSNVTNSQRAEMSSNVHSNDHEIRHHELGHNEMNHNDVIMSHNDLNGMNEGERIYITHSDEDEDIDVENSFGNIPSVYAGFQNSDVFRSFPNMTSSHKNMRPMTSPKPDLPKRASVIVSREQYTRQHQQQRQQQQQQQQHFNENNQSLVNRLNPIKIEPVEFTNESESVSEDNSRKSVNRETDDCSGTVELYPVKSEPNFEPTVDQSLVPYSPASRLRMIEEHNQYRGNDPDQTDRMFKCGYCHKVFRRKEEKKRHENSHLNIRSHKCKVCSKTFMRADHRNSHEKTHNTKKEFNCKICNKSFRRADEHKRHMTRQIHLRNVQRANMAAAKSGKISDVYPAKDF